MTIITNANELTNKEFNLLQKILFKKGYRWWVSDDNLIRQDSDNYYIRFYGNYLFRGDKKCYEKHYLFSEKEYKKIKAITYIRKYKCENL